MANKAAGSIEKKKSTNKFFKYGCLPLVGIFIIIYTIIGRIGDQGRVTAPYYETTQAQESSQTEYSIKNSAVIPGLSPVDVYLNMEKQGFTTEKIFSEEYGNNWMCKSKVDGIDFRVDIVSMDITHVERVRATAMIDPALKSIIATQPFIMYVASLPIENAKPEETIQWVKDNFYNDKATKIVGGAKFTIYAPSKFYRMLDVAKNVD